MHGVQKLNRLFPIVRCIDTAFPGEEPQIEELESDALEQDSFLLDSDDSIPSSSPYVQFEGSDGRPGFVSFYNRPYRRDNEILTFYPQKNQNNLQWILGPTVLVTSFILPSLYLRRILSTVFEDSLLTGNEAMFIGFCTEGRLLFSLTSFTQFYDNYGDGLVGCGGLQFLWLIHLSFFWDTFYLLI